MRREIKDVKRIGECCPGHDAYPADTYGNNRSKRARSKGIKIEHRYVRRVTKNTLKNEVDTIIQE